MEWKMFTESRLKWGHANAGLQLMLTRRRRKFRLELFRQVRHRAPRRLQTSKCSTCGQRHTPEQDWE